MIRIWVCFIFIPFIRSLSSAKLLQVAALIQFAFQQFTLATLLQRPLPVLQSAREVISQGTSGLISSSLAILITWSM